VERIHDFRLLLWVVQRRAKGGDGVCISRDRQHSQSVRHDFVEHGADGFILVLFAFLVCPGAECPHVEVDFMDSEAWNHCNHRTAQRVEE